jgi:hypothetical protein
MSTPLKRGEVGSTKINEAIAARSASGTPVDGVAATGVVTFSGVVSDGDTVTIGADVYEFDTDSSVAAGNIAVDVSGGVTAAQAVTALALAITTSDTQEIGGVDGAGDTVDLTSEVKGTVGNKALAKSGTNITVSGAALTGGVNGTPCKTGDIKFDATNIYIALADGTTADSGKWKKVAHGAL